MYLLFFLLSLCTVVAKSVFAETATQVLRTNISVTVNNLSTSVHCAEDDNVYLPFLSPRLSSFRIEVRHPAYIGSATQDRSAPDWTDCDMSHDPVITQEARQVTIYQTPNLWLVGYTHPTTWQANPVPFRVGGRVEHGLDLVQLWIAGDDGAEEVLVVYPQDGYWRVRPLPTAHLGENAYGSSFLVGPVEVGTRPFVALSEIVFEPVTREFRLRFARGGTARLRLDTVDQRHSLLDVSFDDRLPSDKPFAALRSMYLADTNADAARVAWMTPGDKGWRQSSVMTFAGASAAEFWLGRTVPSRHNLSAPDIVFGSFRHRAPERSFVAQTDEARLMARP